MIEIAFSSSFIRAFKKKIKNSPFIEELFFSKLEIFINNPFEKSLRTHKLMGKLSHCWSFSLDIHYRVVFTFVENNKVVLEDIGNHEEVY